MSRISNLLIVLLIAVTTASAQVKIYYDNNCGITMKGLDTSYRTGTVDTVLGKFVGDVREYWSNDTIMLSIVYDLAGARNGTIKLSTSHGTLRLQGQYLNGQRSGIWNLYGSTPVTINYNENRKKSNKTIDSLEVCLNLKEQFKVSQYIRRRDYPDIYSLITDSQSRYVNKAEVFTIVEEPAYFPTGLEMLGQFIGALIKYPEEALKNNIKEK